MKDTKRFSLWKTIVTVIIFNVFINETKQFCKTYTQISTHQLLNKSKIQDISLPRSLINAFPTEQHIVPTAKVTYISVYLALSSLQLIRPYCRIILPMQLQHKMLIDQMQNCRFPLEKETPFDSEKPPWESSPSSFFFSQEIPNVDFNYFKYKYQLISRRGCQ